ncbi:MAG TPA: hypothetical protein VMX94_04455 [Armatimonadota bacterium]|nr:hypothetical protein [Armatimonadota bacterium]
MPRRIVLCGSMSNYGDMLSCLQYLQARGIPCIGPQPDEDASTAQMSDSQFLDFKRRISRAYLIEIRRAATFGILVVNTPKRGIPNYIGANAFAEVAVAFNAKKRIYLFDGFYDLYSDELQAWRATPLHRDLSLLVQHYIDEEFRQPTLFPMNGGER